MLPVSFSKLVPKGFLSVGSKPAFQKSGVLVAASWDAKRSRSLRLLRDTVDSVGSRNRWLLAWLSQPARTLPARFHHSNAAYLNCRFSTRLFNASSLWPRFVPQPTSGSKASENRFLDRLRPSSLLDRSTLVHPLVLISMKSPKSQLNAPIFESELVCPICGSAKRETMQTDSCQFFYECTNCRTLLRPKPGDCCVFCSYGSVKCPSMQKR